MLRLMIVEDHQLMRDGLRALLEREEDIRIVAEAEEGSRAVELALAHGPDVILMDVSLPNLNGIEATRRILSERPDLNVLVLTMHDDAQTLDHALRAGARGIMLKGGSATSLVEAIRIVARKEAYLDPSLSDHLLRGYLATHGESGSARDQLTPREREILQLIAEGHTSQEIATRLEVKTKTIQNARAIIMEKLQVRTTAGLVRAAINMGLTHT